ncbi:MAG: EamA family transporter [Halobacteriovoraceae bacterium]|nr:EamA family transporter [Halobacteriovoraceae bacterium]|tara:strand:+ start:101288 stop:102133 length:846 start_codon:yes stop_codon:yes gene_type:complete
MLSTGVKHILLASLFFSIINALVKYYSHIPAIEIVFFRSLVTLILSYSVIWQKKIKIFNEHFNLLFLRGLCGAIALSLYFYTIQVMPLATAVTVLYLAPVFTVVLSVFLVKESPNPKQWPFIVAGFVGAALMKSFDPNTSLLHFMMGMTAALFAGLAYNFIRLLKDRAHHQLIIFFFPLITIPVCLPFLVPVWVTPILSDLFGLILIGVCTQIAQVFMTKAYMAESASKISHFNYLTAVWALLTGIIFFDEMLSWISIAGMGIIIVSVIMSSRYAAAKVKA